MSRFTLRRIRRLRADAAPVIAELGRRRRDWANSLPRLAEDHLLSVIIVFRYGEPGTVEPLALAYRRALSNLAGNEQWPLPDLRAVPHLRAVLEAEPPAGDIKSKISTSVRQMPDWLRYFCRANLSMRLLGLEAPPLPKRLIKLFQPSEADEKAWPLLPQGILEPRRDDGEQDRFWNEMSREEQTFYLAIWVKPENQRTRRERRSLRELNARDPNMHGPDSTN